MALKIVFFLNICNLNECYDIIIFEAILLFLSFYYIREHSQVHH